MKKTKVYRPRRGMRFTNGRRGVDPIAGFVGGPAITRTRPTTGKVNLALRKTDTLNVSGSVMNSIEGPDGFYVNPTTPTVLSSSLHLEGAVSTGRLYERKKLDAALLGKTRSTVGKAAWPSTAVVDPSPTGSFVVPSWAGMNLGGNRSFVISALSSSDESLTSLNYWRSGSETIETSAVPASAPLNYSKKSLYQTITVKKTASIFDTAVGNPPAGVFVPQSFAPGTGSFFSVVTGSGGAFSGSLTSTATITMNVPVTGKLVDIRVWVEIVHLSGGSGVTANKQYPLGCLGIALRAPNLTWGNAHPIRNDPRLILADQAVFGLPGLYSANEESNFYRDTFILWEGAAVIANGGANGILGPESSDPGYNTAKYPTWQKDRSMRTIFSDSGVAPNPRHLYALTSPSGNYVGSPNAFVHATGSAYGNNTPWTSDRTIFPATESLQAAGSPPKGWLTGPGGTAAVNEWPTTGSNYGAETIRPMYPLLDPIYARKIIGDELPLVTVGEVGEFGFSDPATVESWRGFRPGLRGTEISGSWKLILTHRRANTEGTTVPVYFRQARLEITYESPSSSKPRVVRQNSGIQARRSGPRFLYRISGSDDSNGPGGIIGPYPDWYVTEIWTDVPNDSEIGRTFGVVLNTGSISQNTGFAVLYRLTGTLADASGSAPGWLLNNSFGMPSIPISSASIVLHPPVPVTGTRPDGFIFPQKSLDGARKLESVAADFNPPKTLIQLAATFVSASAT